MNFESIIIESLYYPMLWVALYLISDILSAHYWYRHFLTQKAKNNIEVARIVMETGLEMAEEEVSRYRKAFDESEFLSSSSEKQRLLLKRLRLRTSSAAGRFALYKAITLSEFKVNFDYEQRIRSLYEFLKNALMDIDGMTAEEAEKQLIEETTFAIADLDYREEFFGNMSVPNPAKDHFRKTWLVGNDKQL